jgi:hypothetical protein
MEAASATAAVIAAATAAAVIATAAAESAARAATITACAAASVPASTAAYVATSAAGISAASIAAASAVAATVAISATIAIAAPAVPAPSVPRAGADEHAAVEPVRTVIAVRGASIGIILVIAPRAIRGAVVADISGINHCGADADSNSDLGARRYSGERQNHKRCQQN